MVKGTEKRDFEELQGLGFKFDGEIDKGDEYDAQPDSGGLMGGERGRQEFGVEENPDVTFPEDMNVLLDDEVEMTVESADDDRPQTGADDPSVVSEWSKSRAEVERSPNGVGRGKGR